MSLLKSIGNIAGAAVGGYFGGPLGAAAGSQFGNMLGPSDERLANRQYVQQYRDAVSFWNMQNEYNSPVAQMGRLRAAGLNPMLVYGSGSVDGNSTSAPSVPSYPQVRSRRSGNWSSVEKFFLNKSMENAEDQNTRNELINENWRLRNLRLARDIEKKGKSSLSDAVRSDKPLSVSQQKYIDKQIEEYNNNIKPTDISKVRGSYNLATAAVENAAYWPLLAMLEAPRTFRKAKSVGFGDLLNTSGKRFNPYEQRYGRY